MKKRDVGTDFLANIALIITLFKQKQLQHVRNKVSAKK